MVKRLNKEYKLDVCDKISLKYGSINREDPQIVYVSGKCWVAPTCRMDYSSVITSIKNDMKKNIKRVLIDGSNFENKYIFDFDVSTEKVEPNVSKFLTFDLYLKQNKENKRPLKELKGLMEDRMGVISNNLMNSFNENDFVVSQRKK